MQSSGVWVTLADWAHMKHFAQGNVSKVSCVTQLLTLWLSIDHIPIKSFKKKEIISGISQLGVTCSW